MSLEIEQATFERRRAEFAAHAGKFVLIHADQVADFFETYEDAIKAGYQRFALKPFLVRQILSSVQASFISRHFDPLAHA